MKKKIAVLLIAAMTAAVALSGCGDKKAGKPDKEQEEFVVGFDQDLPPMGFVGDDGEYTGFDLEVAEAVAEKMGMKYVPNPIAWDAKSELLKSGGIDCVWNGFTKTGREDDYAWTDAYLNNSQVFVVRGDSGIESESDLAGKIVEVQIDSSAEKALQKNTELSDTFADLRTVAEYNTGFMDLESGSVDAVAMDIVVAAYQIEKRDADLVILDYSIADEEYAVGFDVDNTELRDKVQAALEELAEDGTLAEISEKWFKKDITVIGK